MEENRGNGRKLERESSKVRERERIVKLESTPPIYSLAV